MAIAEVLIRAFHVPRFLLPTPTAVIEFMYSNPRDLLSALGTTAEAALIGFFAAAFLGIALAIASSRFVSGSAGVLSLRRLFPDRPHRRHRPAADDLVRPRPSRRGDQCPGRLRFPGHRQHLGRAALRRSRSGRFISPQRRLGLRPPLEAAISLGDAQHHHRPSSRGRAGGHRNGRRRISRRAAGNRRGARRSHHLGEKIRAKPTPCSPTCSWRPSSVWRCLPPSISPVDSSSAIGTPPEKEQA